MHAALRNNLFFIKEHVGIFKAANNYDIFDPNSQQKILECREPNLGFFSKLLRFTDYKRFTPFDVVVSTPEGQKVLSVKRGVSIFLSKVQVLDGNDQVVGSFRQKLFSIGGKFDVLDAQEQIACTLKGKWTSWDFRFVQGSTEFAAVSKKWAGLGKELFTTADNYMLSIDPGVPANDARRLLIVAAVMCIDMVLKE
ncbi:phospholipid scramblase family protein [Variovorax paradoxus]|uniref:phospholipid scramblase family protein n=1 Tax=Variovorax paradoxus TaxID=34073 RepID=UPI0021AC08F1|nr:phospholipid scramblase family protein [Variovorax paradoxus]UVH59161.1 phospholipid scramblase family protein [Variovorax paradoxus]